MNRSKKKFTALIGSLLFLSPFTVNSSNLEKPSYGFSYKGLYEEIKEKTVINEQPEILAKRRKRKRSKKKLERRRLRKLNSRKRKRSKINKKNTDPRMPISIKNEIIKTKELTNKYREYRKQGGKESFTKWKELRNNSD